MSSTSKTRGHNIIYVNDEWLYEDTKTPTVGNERSCGFCGKGNTPEGYDGCLGELPNVMNACCSHGDVDGAYVQFDEDNCIRGEEALEWINENKSVSVSNVLSEALWSALGNSTTEVSKGRRKEEKCQ